MFGSQFEKKKKNEHTKRADFLTHNEVKYQWIEMIPEMIQMIELVHRETKIVTMFIFKILHVVIKMLL